MILYGKDARAWKNNRGGVLQLVRKGWSSNKVYSAYDDFAKTLVEDGYKFRKHDRKDADAIEQLIQDNIAGQQSYKHPADPKDAGVVAVASDGEIAGVLTFSVVRLDTSIVSCIRSMVTSPKHRNRGIGTVLITGIMTEAIKEVAGRPQDKTFGNCGKNEAKFYQVNGFDVGQVGEPVPLIRDKNGIEREIGIASEHHPHPIVREW